MRTPSETILVGELPADIDDDTVRSVFGMYGTVERAKVVGILNSTGRARAVVKLASLMEAQWLVENGDGNYVQGLSEPITVRFATQPGPGQQPGGGYGKLLKAPAARGAAGPYVGAAGALRKGGGGDEFSVAHLMATLERSVFPPTIDRSALIQLYVSGLPPDTTDLDLALRAVRVPDKVQRRKG
ncbi:unnamed protein product, partial [Prorocentrum cordatum]